MSQESNFLSGIVIGAIVGAVAGILLAPESGEETRNKIAKKTEGLKEEIESKFTDIVEKINSLENEKLSDFKEKFYDVKGSLKEKYSSVADKIEQLEDELSSKFKAIEKEALEKVAEAKND